MAATDTGGNLTRIACLVLAAVMLAGCLQTSPQLKQYQMERDVMMAAGNRDQR